MCREADARIRVCVFLLQLTTTPHDYVSELQLSLCYNNNIQRLTVGVFAGKNFNVHSRNNASGKFANMPHLAIQCE
jgi:hypothetical protein